MAAIRAFDALLLRVERAVVAAMLALMGLVVFLDVAYRVSTRTGSLLAEPVVVAGVGAVIGWLALRTRGTPQAFARGVGIGVALAAAQLVYVRVLPNGLVWSQTLALALTLWLGCIGASIAAHERRHLALDVGSKIWPPALAGRIAAMGHLATALFCVVLLGLGLRSVEAHLELWEQTDGAAGTLSGTAIPKWAAAAAIPYGMTVLAFRFLLEAWDTWTGRVAVGGDDTLHQLGIEEQAS